MTGPLEEKWEVPRCGQWIHQVWSCRRRRLRASSVRPFLPPRTWVLLGVSGRPRAQHFQLWKRRHAARETMSHQVGTPRSAAAGLRVETSLATHFAGVATGDAELAAAVVVSPPFPSFERRRRPLQFHVRRCHAPVHVVCPRGAGLNYAPQPCLQVQQTPRSPWGAQSTKSD